MFFTFGREPHLVSINLAFVHRVEVEEVRFADGDPADIEAVELKVTFYYGPTCDGFSYYPGEEAIKRLRKMLLSSAD